MNFVSQEQIKLTKVIPQTLDKTRLDSALSVLLPEYSRARIQTWIREGYVTVDGKILRPKDQVAYDQIINIVATIKNVIPLQPQSIALEIVYADQDLIVVNKPAGLVTHPGAGNLDGTLLNALLYHYPELAALPRAGIIHRLDKDTSGLMVVARNLVSHHQLSSALQARAVKREYVALVNGSMIAGGVIEAPIGRHRTQRTLMAVQEGGRAAVTHYRVIERFPRHTYVRVRLETGRTHQIRVHLAHIGYPLVGDPVYGRITKVSEKFAPELRHKLETFKRQVLHACCLELRHPGTDKMITWEAEVPADIKELLQALQKYPLPTK